MTELSSTAVPALTPSKGPGLSPPTGPAEFAVRKRRIKLLGLTIDDAIKAFFGGNALVSIIVLALITVFLLREGAGFFGLNRDNLRVYREAGLEYVDFI